MKVSVECTYYTTKHTTSQDTLSTISSTRPHEFSHAWHVIPFVVVAVTSDCLIATNFRGKIGNV